MPWLKKIIFNMPRLNRVTDPALIPLKNSDSRPRKHAHAHTEPKERNALVRSHQNETLAFRKENVKPPLYIKYNGERAREEIKKKVAVKQVLHLFGCLRGCAVPPPRGLGHFFSGAQGSRNVENSAAAALKPRGIKELVQDKHTTRLYFIFYLARS
jgi:hypothetical protein